jgi:hypothetical protein
MADLQIGGVDDTYEFIVGTSILTEFALSHTPADVLRELVQNEYDAGGTELQIEFGNETLIVRGNGTPIDAQGWKRLAVMLGTGAIAGSSERIDAKVNGIGSKNFGMRSLFLFGDSIHVASGGKRTILDRTRGSLKILQSDPASERASGVVITVPYRSVDDGPLEVFDTARERDALSAIASQLAHTVIKLAQPGPGNSLRTVHLRSERLGHELRWSQTARRADGPRGPVRRTVRVKASPGLLDGSSASISELEYHAVLEPPVPMRTRNLPGYFRVAGGRIRIGLSFRLRGKRLDLNAGGLLYYPLGAPSAHTGFPFSVSAPFDMNEDRSNIIDPQNSGWNSWLLEQVAQFAIRTLPERLFPDHGADAYAAVVPSSGGTAALPELDDKIRELISTEHCWPSRAKRRGGRAKFAPAKSLVVPPKSGLAKYIARFLSVEQLMEADLADRDEVTQLAVKCGAKVFTESSVVRLRSAGESSDHLETKISDREANYHYMDFPEPLEKLDLQRTFAAALDECWPRLVPGHKADLRTAPTTLTAAGTLDAAENLYVLDEAFAGVVPAGERLHPDLMSYPCLTRLCNPFHASQWVIRKSKELADGTGSVEDRVALAAYIRGAPQLSKKAWAAVQHAPILSDRRGELVAPRDMVRSSAKGATVLAYALHIPLPEDEGNESLKQLKFREKVAGSDLMHLAMLVEEGSVPPKVMAIACRRLPELLSRSVIRQLSDIGFLETESGAISAPTQTYSRSERLVAVLGEEAPYAVGLTPKVLRHLGCRSEALADDIVAALSRWNESGRKPSRSELACRALVDALRHERRATNEFENHDIIWTGRAWRHLPTVSLEWTTEPAALDQSRCSREVTGMCGAL